MKIKPSNVVEAEWVGTLQFIERPLGVDSQAARDGTPVDDVQWLAAIVSALVIHEGLLGVDAEAGRNDPRSG